MRRRLSVRPLAGWLALAAVAGWVWVAPFSLLGTANLALGYAMIAVSIVLLTGWVGQISLAQATFVGIGAFATGVVVREWGIDFPFTLAIGAVVAAGAAALLGLVALRVRGLYLAVATLIFAWMAQEYLFNQPWLAGVGGSSSAPIEPIGSADRWPFLDFSDRRTFYYWMLAAAVTAAIGAANLRDSKTGRAWFAVKGSEIAAASLGVPVVRYKLLAFAASGFIAGVAGNLIMTHQQVVTAPSFSPAVSLFYLAIAVVGGLTSLGGAFAAGALFALLEELFFRVDALAGLLQVVSAALLAIVLLFFPAGLAGLPARVGAALRRRREEAAAEEQPEAAEAREPKERGRIAGGVASVFQRVRPPKRRRTVASGAGDRDALAIPLAVSEDAGAEAAEAASSSERGPALTYEPGTATRPELPPRAERSVVMAARDITVRFGGLTAVDSANLEIREGEIVGLIGPNGAGKTTLFNAISGLNNPASGEVELFDEDITGLDVHQRAALGMGRTFQVIQLFPQLSVFENLLVATHLRNPTGFFAHLVVTRAGAEGERAAHHRVRQVVGLLGLEDVADRRVADLPFGVLRMVEIARALVTGAPFVMLDEPASGLDNTETDRLMDLLFWVRQTLHISLLVIEHDVRMVTGVSDYLYVIDRGKMIAQGTAQQVQRDPAVIAAYLGAVGDPTPVGG